VTGPLLLADVSHHNGDGQHAPYVDWAAYGSWSPAAIAKATEDVDFTDPAFTHNRAGMRAHLAARGFYHMLAPGDPVAQARHFAAAIGELQPGEFIALDVETNAEHARHEAFATEADRLLHPASPCWIYGGAGNVRTARPVWVARYPRGVAPSLAARWRPGEPVFAGEPRLPHQLWQFSDYAVDVPGVGAGLHVDINVHRGDLTSLLTLIEGDHVALTLSAEDKQFITDTADAAVAKIIGPRRAGTNQPYNTINDTTAVITRVEKAVHQLAASQGGDPTAIALAVLGELAALLAKFSKAGA
jgi:GH25 family lysozyme M1 (1,4-beta-N-acetylmuramidase)